LVSIPREQLPENIGEGDHLKVEINNGKVVAAKIDESARQ